MNTAYPQIPYGWTDFEGMRRERTLYVDKTRFLHESGAGAIRLADPAPPLRQVVLGSVVGELLRPQPRRSVRGDLRRHRHRAVSQRPNRHRYVILRFDFSAFDDTPETLRERFENLLLHQTSLHALKRISRTCFSSR